MLLRPRHVGHPPAVVVAEPPGVLEAGPPPAGVLDSTARGGSKRRSSRRRTVGAAMPTGIPLERPFDRNTPGRVTCRNGTAARAHHPRPNLAHTHAHGSTDRNSPRLSTQRRPGCLYRVRGVPPTSGGRDRARARGPGEPQSVPGVR
jgi:hypothetical protein